jgi:hypothetical protein
MEVPMTTDDSSPLNGPLEHDVPPKPPVPPPKPAASLTQRPPAAAPGPAEPDRRRDDELFPWLAALLSVVPCLGHLYARAPGRALGLFVSWIVALTMLPFGLNIAACFFLWFFGIFDAYREAQLANLDDPNAARASRGTSGLALGVFLAVTGGLLLGHHVYGLSFEWLREWWPLVLIAGGVYLIGEWLVGRMRSSRDAADVDAFEDI